MNILIIDGQGGKIGCQLIKLIADKYPETEITAVGTNSIATSAMIKFGAGHAATGENACLVASKNADVIIGPIGIVIADSLLGEVTPAMALAVSQSRAVRILIPTNKCDNIVAGVPDLSITALLDDVVQKLSGLLDK